MSADAAKLRLYGFNNLTKHLSVNLYDVCWANSEVERREYLAYIDEFYNAERLTKLLTDCSNLIGANILNLASQDYEPQGASVTILISEEPVAPADADAVEAEQRAAGLAAESREERGGPLVGDQTNEVIVGHLDKSHICVHTYPEHHPDNGICTFRADIEISTCGRISPLLALNHILDEFEPDVANLDYRVRGFTRDITGRKFFIDHQIHSIQDQITPELLDRYHAVDVNVYQENLFHTKMMWKNVDLDRYVFDGTDGCLRIPEDQHDVITKRLSDEISEIFYGRNFG